MIMCPNRVTCIPANYSTIQKYKTWYSSTKYKYKRKIPVKQQRLTHYKVLYNEQVIIFMSAHIWVRHIAFVPSITKVCMCNTSPPPFPLNIFNDNFLNLCMLAYYHTKSSISVHQFGLTVLKELFPLLK